MNKPSSNNPKKVELEEAKVERVEKKKSGNKMKAYVQMQK